MCSFYSMFSCITEGVFPTDTDLVGSVFNNLVSDEMFFDAMKEGLLAMCACIFVLVFTRSLRYEKSDKLSQQRKSVTGCENTTARNKSAESFGLHSAAIGATPRKQSPDRVPSKAAEGRRHGQASPLQQSDSLEASVAAAEAIDRLLVVAPPTLLEKRRPSVGCVSAAAAGLTMASSSVTQDFDMSSGEVTRRFLSFLDGDRKDDAETFLRGACDAGAKLDKECVTNLFRRLIHSADTGSARLWLERFSDMQDQTLLQCGYVGLVCGSADAGNAARAEFWLHRAASDGLARNPALYSAVINAWAQAKDPKRAGSWLAKMEEEAEEINAADSSTSRFAPSAVDYTTVMCCCARGGYSQQVEVLFLRMIAAKLIPDPSVFATIVKQLILNDGPNAADKWLRYARRYELKLDGSVFQAAIATATHGGYPEAAERYLTWQLESGSQPSLQSYKPLISVWAKRGDAIRAERLIDAMIGNGISPDSTLLGMVIHACAKAGDAHRAEQAFKRIASRTGEKPNVICYNSLIDAFAKSGETASAEQWLATMAAEGVEPTVASYTSVLHAYARAGDLRAAERMLERMTERGVQANVVSYGALLQGFVKTGDVARAEKWFAHMQEAGIEPNNVTYSTLINVCAKAHDSERAEKWLDTMQSSGVAPTTVCYNCIIDACTEAGRCDRAELWLRRLCEASRLEKAHDGDKRSKGPRTSHGNAPQSLMPTSASYTSAARAYAMVGSWSDCERLLTEMESAGIRMDGVSLTVLLTSYARARPQQRSRAEAAARRFSNQGMQIARPSLAALKWAVGAERFGQLCAELGLEGEAIRGPSYGHH